MFVSKYRFINGSLRPAIDVIFASGEFKYHSIMLIDTGADMTLFPLAVGHELGWVIGREVLKNVYGIAGVGLPYVTRKVALSVAGLIFEVNVGWILSDQAPLVLGRKNVFERFRITIDEKERVTEWVGKV